MYTPAVADMVSMAGRVQRDAIGADVISKTLDTMTSASFGGVNKASVGISNTVDYAFQTSVLNAAYSDRGSIVDLVL